MLIRADLSLFIKHSLKTLYVQTVLLGAGDKKMDELQPEGMSDLRQ